MTVDEIVDNINKYFICYDFGEDWLAIPKQYKKNLIKFQIRSVDSK